MTHDDLAPLPLSRRLKLAAVRAMAWLYDAFLVVVVLFFAAIPAVAINRGEAVDSGNPLFLAYLIVVAGAYYVYSWTRGGQTMGMRAWRLVVTDEAGSLPRVKQSTIRYAVGLIGTVLLGLDLWSALADREGRSLTDRLSGTRVGRIPQAAGGKRRAASAQVSQPAD